MPDLINAQMFYDCWRDVCKTKNDILFENWSNRKTYTSIVLDYDNSIVKEISTRLGLKTYREYYMLDAVFYDDKDLVPFAPTDTTWLKRIRIGFEHEHNITSVYQEISHLLITNCDLRVLVTYPIDDEQKDLKYFQEIIRGSKLNPDSSLLVIFGWDMENNDISWEGYQLNLDNWIKLT